MVMLYLFYILVLLQGHDCIINLQTTPPKTFQYLVNGEDSACIFDTSGITRLSKCIEKPVDKELLFDMDFNRGDISFFTNTNFLPFFPREYGKSSRIIHWRNILPSKLHRCPWRLPEYNEVVDIALDWVHETIYVIDFGGKRLTGYRCQRRDSPTIKVMNFSIDADYFTENFNWTTDQLSLKSVRVDPYLKYLFIQITDTFQSGNYSKNLSVIVRSNLGVTNTKFIPNQFFSTGMKFYVDVSELKMYILEQGSLYIFDYYGKKIERKSFISKEIKDFIVFQDTVHYNVYYSSDRVNHITQVDLNAEPSRYGLQPGTYTAQLYGAERTLMLLDARSKRVRVNGTYICDRTDCPDSCEVLPTGDTCVCRKSRAKTRDGLTCYDCGQSNLTTISDHLLIAGGQDASRADFPWHSIIYELTDGGWKQTCGGTLISPSVVLTAAHCVTTLFVVKEPELKKIENLMVAVGKIYRDYNITESSEIKLRVKEIRPHEDFMGGTINYAQDIALLFLASKVNYSRYVMPACLDYNLNQLPHYSTLTAYIPGFGYTSECGSLCSDQSKVLKYASTEVISFLDCFKASQAKNPSIFLVLTPDRFCIGNGSASAVQKGDSGGGLTMVHNGLHYVSGVVSIKLMKFNGSSISYSFGSFTNVTYNMDWLLRNLPEGE